ncbi:MAG: type IV pilin protein [Gammaproteobacteria bacterium]|nr:type IV pilin protein [Gammaproteobacteria bacterium]
MISRGYTLIELMVVVAIIGIIAAVAYPSYQGYMRDTYAGQAVADLKLCALELDRYYSNGFTYVGATVGDDGTETCYEWSPRDAAGSADARYQLSLPTLTKNDYVVRASPLGEGECIELEANGTQSSC